MQHDAQRRLDLAAGDLPRIENLRRRCPADAPPFFVAIADDGILVAPIFATRLYEAWHKAAKPAELHIFTGGRHGFGMKKQNLLSDSWIDLFRNSLAAQAIFLQPKKILFRKNATGCARSREKRSERCSMLP
jgi:acetyl esterase/lipase